MITRKPHGPSGRRATVTSGDDPEHRADTRVVVAGTIKFSQADSVVREVLKLFVEAASGGS